MLNICKTHAKSAILLENSTEIPNIRGADCLQRARVFNQFTKSIEQQRLQRI